MTADIFGEGNYMQRAGCKTLLFVDNATSHVNLNQSNVTEENIFNMEKTRVYYI